MSDDPYVSNSAWLDPAGRADAIDEIADQFERRVEPTAWPVESGAESYWQAIELHRSAPARAAAMSFVPRTMERRAG
jgi:hypothetical protein